MVKAVGVVRTIGILNASDKFNFTACRTPQFLLPPYPFDASRHHVYRLHRHGEEVKKSYASANPRLWAQTKPEHEGSGAVSSTLALGRMSNSYSAAERPWPAH